MKSLSLIALTGLMIATGCSGEKKTEKETTRVNVAVVEPSTESGSYITTGRVKSKDEMQIAFRVSGTIERVYVKEGQFVHRGQLLASMDARDYQVQLDAVEAEYASIKAQADRVIALYEDEATSAENYDKARYGLMQITSKLQHARDQVADTRLYAPIDGYVQDVIFKENETVGAGMAVLSIEGKGTLQVEASLPAKIAAERNRFASITCVLKSNGNEYPLSIDGIKQKATAAQTYTATFNLPQGTDALIGTSCSITIRFNDSEGGDASTAVIPTSAILEKDGQAGVYEYSDGTLRFRNVVVERYSRDGQAFIKNGVIPGDTIVVSGVHHVADGDRVVPVMRCGDNVSDGGLL